MFDFQPFIHLLESGTFVPSPRLPFFLFFCERAPPPGLALGLSPVVFLLPLRLPGPASSWGSGLRKLMGFLEVKWR